MSYFDYNLPLQAWPEYEIEDDETSPVVDTRIVNYMPRKELCSSLMLSEILAESGQTRQKFFDEVAQHLENLARLMRAAGVDPSMTVYYHTEGMES